MPISISSSGIKKKLSMTCILMKIRRVFMVKKVNITEKQYKKLCEDHGKSTVNRQIDFLNSIYKKSVNQESHTTESGIDYDILSMACA